ncbi:hypothetical protein ACJMK2_005712 [Sinanodonta woodiana]|uniref:ADP-ribosylhydrolase ARH3 n=1 Tax=Sinanodonta woodiana TaxID=1069815 RepID=A0ABD3VS94_SINWO
MVSRISRFHGSLVGAVVGDCIGAVFEEAWLPGINIDRVLRQVEKIEADNVSSNSQVISESQNEDRQPRKIYKFTDDTAMARSVAASLIEENGLNVKDMARRFSEEYFKEPWRGYGGNICLNFQALKESNYLDPFGPASRQFGGHGSYGNGGAMRIAPAALFAFRKQMDLQKLRELVEPITKLTHTHPHAVQGAMLESLAVNLALKTDCLDPDQFIDYLCDKMKIVEDMVEEERRVARADNTDSPDAKRAKEEIDDDKDEETDNDKDEMRNQLSYSEKLEKIRTYIKQELQPDTKEIIEVLGTDISALNSVPAAVYAFLRATKEIKGIQDRNPFEKTIIYAISLGGDTDTIATMAGAIAGAYYGIEEVPKSWQEACEGVADALQYATRLYDLPIEHQAMQSETCQAMKSDKHQDMKSDTHQD